MPIPPKPTTVEKVAGSLSVEGALTYIAAAAGTPLAALLPVLGKSLAAERQKQRVDRTLREMSSIMEAHSAELARLTDQQYKFINEAVLALLHTTSEEKMAYLKNVVLNGMKPMELQDQEAVFLSRIVRDISADEARFLIANFGFERIWLNDTEPGENNLPTLSVKPQTPLGQVVLGLVTLGLVANAEPTWDDSGLLRYTPMAGKLIALMQDPGT